MSRLRPMTYREAAERLRRHGFVFERHAKGSHEIWFNPKSRMRTTLMHHPGDIATGTLRAIIRQTGLTVDEFLR